jgi:6,7-dimethyl-8-ribityllumazine synthase
MTEETLRILIVEARDHADIADALLEGASDALRAFGADFDAVAAPTAFELPAVIAFADSAGKAGGGVRYDGYVALGCVIRDDTTQYDYLCGESARGLMTLSVERELAIGYGVLTVEDEEQAWARARISEADRGGAAARACMDMVALKRQLAEANQ